jgi:protein-S-isoprenylcysteine O-methyltransferase Ste14
MNPSPWLPLALGIAAGAALAGRSLSLRRQGVDPWVLPTGDDAPGFLGRAFVGLVALWAFVLVTWAVAPGWAIRALGAVPILIGPGFSWAGVALMLAGVVIVVAGQRAMGKAWRVGIKTEDRPGLVTEGVFGWSRNPVFLGMLLAALGATLMIPHGLSLAALAATYLALSVQIRLEEAYLDGWLGKAYADYTAKVGRWFGRRG